LATADARARRDRLRPFLPRSLAARLSLVTAAVLAVALGAVSAVRTIALTNRLYYSTADQLAADYTALQPSVDIGPGTLDTFGPAIANRLASPSVGILVIDTGANITARQDAGSTPNVSPPVLATAVYARYLAQFARTGPNEDIYVVASSAGVRQVVVLEPAWNRAFGLVGMFELATSVAPINRTVRQQLEFDMLAGLLALLGASAAIYFLLGRFLAPLQDMAYASDQMARGRLDVELPRAEGDDEVSRLSRAFSHMVRRIEASLEGEREEQRRMRAFLADASHSLRTPLTVLNGRLDLLLHGESREGDELETSLRTLRVEGERMARIVRGLLLLARLEEEDPQPSEPVGLDAVLEGIRPRLETLAGDRDLVIATEPGLSAWATVDAIETITTNLVENAVRHTADDGSIQIRADRQGDMTRLRVLDSGSGIAEADLPHVFDRFYRGAISGRRRDGGAGLGLSIVQRWTEALGGRVEAANRDDGRGAAFTIWLRPDAPPPSPTPAA
jgi:two-component system OmpR family sensor kinase